LELNAFRRDYWIAAGSPAGFVTFQDAASSSMQAISFFNLHLLFVVFTIALVVGWVLGAILFNFTEWRNSVPLEFMHSPEVEVSWTSAPALVLLILSIPSFSLLFSFDEAVSPELSLKIMGHQWYWSYELADNGSCFSTDPLKYSSYMVGDSILATKVKEGVFRVIETSKRIVLPINFSVRMLVTSVDVLHSWAIPSFGIKVDACPGRLSRASVFLKRTGVFFGQCSEICGVNHGFMPAVVVCASADQIQKTVK